MFFGTRIWNAAFCFATVFAPVALASPTLQRSPVPICNQIPPDPKGGNFGACPASGAGGSCAIHYHDGTGEVTGGQTGNVIEGHVKCDRGDGTFDVYVVMIDCSGIAATTTASTAPDMPVGQPGGCSPDSCCTGPLTGDQAQIDCALTGKNCGNVFHSCGASLSAADKQKFCANRPESHPACTITSTWDPVTGTCVLMSKPAVSTPLQK